MTTIKTIASLAAISVATMGFAGAAQAELKFKNPDKKPPCMHCIKPNKPNKKHHHDDFGYGVGAGLFGFAAGAMIGSAMASQQEPEVVYVRPGRAAWIEYCFSKYDSYDPRTNLYIGYDNRYHQCR